MCTIRVKGTNLRNLRVRKGLSMNEFSKLIHVNVGVVSRIENCIVNPRPKTAHKICKALGVEFDELFEIVDKGA